MYVVTDVRDLYDWFRMSFESEAGRDLFCEVKVKRKSGDKGVDGGGSGSFTDHQIHNEEVHDEKDEAEIVEEGGEDPDPCIPIMQTSTEEGKKVSRNGGDKFVAVWQRKENPPWPS